MIAVATGKITEVEIATSRQNRQAKQRAMNRAAKIVVGDNKVQQTLPPPTPQPSEPDLRAHLIARIIQKLGDLSLAQLYDIERNIPVPNAANIGSSA